MLLLHPLVDFFKLTDPEALDSEKLQEYLEFANRYCAKSVQKKGAIASYPSAEEMA